MTVNLPVANKKYVGPRIPSIIKYIPKARRALPDLMYQVAKEYGPVIHLRFGMRDVFFVSGPKGVEHVLQSNQHNYRGWNYSHVQLRPLLGNGLLTSEGETWLKHRRLVQQAFLKGQLEKLSRLMAVTIRNFIVQWETCIDSTATLDIGTEMGLLTLSVVTESLFGTKMGKWALRVRDAWPLVMDHLVGRMVNPLRVPEQLPVYGNRQYQKALALLNNAIYMLITEHRAGSHGAENLMGMLIAARDHKLDIKLDEQELRDEIMTIFLAGHETCANALTWTFFLLARHPEVQQRLADEASTVLAGREPDYTDIGQMPYTTMVFNEALRLYPPAWIMARDVLHDDEIEGWRIPAGSLVFLSPYVTHRLADYWNDPLNFNPENFSREDSVNRPRFAYFPFGGGQRQCLGKNFALMEAQLALPMLVQKYHFSMEDKQNKAGETNSRHPTYAMRPHEPVLLKIEKRSLQNKPGVSYSQE